MSICVRFHGIVLALYGISSINLYALYKIQSACLISCGLSIQEFLDTFIYRSVSSLIRLVIPVLLIVFVYKVACGALPDCCSTVGRTWRLVNLSISTGRFGREIECQLNTGKLFQVFVINFISQNNRLSLHQIYKFFLFIEFV